MRSGTIPSRHSDVRLLSSLMKSFAVGVSKKLRAALLASLVMLAAGSGLVSPAFGQPTPQAPDAEEGIRVEKPSAFTKLVPAEQLERSAQQQFSKMKAEAAKKNALAAADDPQLIRLQDIAKRLLPYTARWNPRANQWAWEVQLFKSDAINAFCMPGGKIGFYLGILEKLKLTDDEVAMIMGHEMAHALREHSRAQLAKNQVTGIGAGLLSSILGLGDVGRTVIDYGAQLTILKFSRDDESEADLIGMDIAARGGFDPRAGVTLWRKMGSASKNAPPQWLSTHPSGSSRIRDIERNLDQVLPIYARAIGKTVDTLPPGPVF
jgi:Zn-dependent protease with chaperone function